MPFKVDFFIVGAPKAGTTALHDYLSHHPEVCMSRVKEPNFFSWQEIELQKLYYNAEHIKTESEYNSLFESNKNTKVYGETSVSYLYYPQVAEKIKSYNKDARIIIILREPVTRAFSHYRMDYSLGLVPYEFSEIVKDSGKSSQMKNYYQQYVQLSDYYEQTERYLHHFGKDQVMIILYDDFQNNSEPILRKICNFLKIGFVEGRTGMKRKNVGGAAKSKWVRTAYTNPHIRKMIKSVMGNSLKDFFKNKLFSKDALPQLDTKTAASLKEYFHPGINRLEKLISRDLSLWKSTTATGKNE